jgi:hypothetical protein
VYTYQVFPNTLLRDFMQCWSAGEVDDASAEPAKVVNPVVEEEVKFEHPGAGCYFEADAVAIDIAACRTENATMPLDETLRMMSLMDGIRKACGLVYPHER